MLGNLRDAAGCGQSLHDTGSLSLHRLVMPRAHDDNRASASRLHCPESIRWQEVCTLLPEGEISMAQRKKATSSKAAGSRSRKGSAATTTDHNQIRQWTEERNGAPACVRGTGGKGDIGMLRIEFPGRAEAKLQRISWDDWFRKFEEEGLAFLFQERTASGRPSRFSKLVNREAAASGKRTLRAGGR